MDGETQHSGTDVRLGILKQQSTVDIANEKQQSAIGGVLKKIQQSRWMVGRPNTTKPIQTQQPQIMQPHQKFNPTHCAH